MKSKLYMPYVDYDSDGFFDYNDEEYSKNYISLLYSEYNKYKDTIDDITRKSLNGKVSMLGSRYNSNNAKKEFKTNYKYYEIETDLFDINEDSNIIDYLIENFQKQTMFPLLLKFNNLYNNQDFESELKLWIRNTVKINNSKNIDEVEKFKILPSKDLKIITDRNSKAILEECKILDIFSIDEIAITVNKIKFIK